MTSGEYYVNMIGAAKALYYWDVRGAGFGNVPSFDDLGADYKLRWFDQAEYVLNEIGILPEDDKSRTPESEDQDVRLMGIGSVEW